ncbi:MAG: M13 family metallopeptidase [Bacteroidetes bacterium]|nr:M13 family metallopeptidase [Bacteroidota bacterium]
MKNITLALFAGIIFSSCQNNNSSSEKKSKDPLVEHIDSSVRAADDFYLYANGKWFKQNPIPSSETGNGIFLIVRDSVNNSIKLICESNAKEKNLTKGSNKQKIGDFFFSGMDTTTIEKLGMTPLEEELKKIDAVKTKDDVLSSIARLHSMSVHPLFGFTVTRDDKLASKYAVFIRQGGIGLPERDYYFNNDARTKNIREEYVKHIIKMFQVMGNNFTEAEKNSTSIMTIETSLAKASRTIEALRDPYKNYNKMTIAEINKISPAVDWKKMLALFGIPNSDTLIVMQPEFFKQVDASLKTVSIADWKIYLKWNLIRNYSPYLSKSFEGESFNFYDRILSGQKEQKPRWKRVVEETESNLEQIVSREYVANYLPKETKDKFIQLATNLMEVYAEHIKKLDWMSDTTKKKALNKLSKVTMKLGWPDTWKDFSSLEIERNTYCANVMRAAKWHYDYMINHWGKPVDRTEWGMTPETYNAYYEPTLNEICIPGCNIIVPGFDGIPDDAVIYGVIAGSTFGHEITHGFDDEGRQYDAEGNLKGWWTKDDSVKFSQRAKLLAEQYNAYTVLDSLHVRGYATLGENIADLGGAVMGFEAFKKTEQYKQNKIINGLTPAQRYFLSFAYSWMFQRTDAALANQIMTNVHSPSQFRVDGPLSNMKDFYEAFNIKSGDKMFRADSVRVVIW